MVASHQPSNAPRHAFSKEEKAALVLLIVCGMGGLFFGFRYLGKNLQSPFSFEYNGPQYLTASEQETAKIDAYKSRDTDADGLNDYDELYIYKTSAYLADSDSDGTNDATEVASGGDPNCPVGKTCAASTTVDVVTDPSEAILQSVPEPVAPDLSAAQEQLNAAENGTVDQEEIINNMTPDQLRELLISNGANETQVKNLTDDQLMQLYQEVLAQYQAGATSP